MQLENVYQFAKSVIYLADVQLIFKDVPLNAYFSFIIRGEGLATLGS